MKRVVILAVVAIIMASCDSDPDFATVGKKVNMSLGRNSGEYHSSEGVGYVIDNKIAVPPIFDYIKYCIERNGDETFGSEYMIAEKNGKYGVVKMFQKKYVADCLYEIVSVIPSKNFLFLKRFGEEMRTYLLDEKREWMGTDFWPPKTFPAEVPVKDLCHLEHWKIRSVKCTGRKNAVRITSTDYEFEMVIEGIKDWSRNDRIRLLGADYYGVLILSLYVDKDGAVQEDLMIKYLEFPILKKGETCKMQFSLPDEKIRDINFTGFLLNERLKKNTKWDED